MKLKLLLLGLSIFFLSTVYAESDDEVKGSVGYKPPLLPIEVTVDEDGDVDLSITDSVNTPLGTFSVGLGKTISEGDKKVDTNINWIYPNENLEYSLLESKDERRSLLVMVRSPECEACDKMENETLKSEMVKNGIQGLLITKVNTTTSGVDKYLPLIKNTPTILFVSTKFNVIDKLEGYSSPQDFLDWLKNARYKNTK